MNTVTNESNRTTASEIPAWARERAEMLQGLYIHGIVFVLINAGLVVINALTRGEAGTWWFFWPLSIWALGFFVHLAVVVFPVFSETWVDRRAAEIARRRS